MSEIELYSKLNAIPGAPAPLFQTDKGQERMREIAAHRIWFQSIRHERPSPEKHFKIGVYIRYFNQTKHEDYLSYHKKQFEDTIALCPAWELVGFYVDEGSTPPNMESAPQWGQLLQDCVEGKVDLIVTQKVSNVSKKSDEIALCARLLACQKPPVGIYFISEDIFTLASYYLEDIRDIRFLHASNARSLRNGADRKEPHDREG